MARMPPRLTITSYYGGKNPHVKRELVDAILGAMPYSRVYVEPFCGLANIFLHKHPRSRISVLNDMDGLTHNLLKVIRERPAELARMVRFTPSKGRQVFRECLAQDAPDDLTRAWQTFVVLRMSMQSSTSANTMGLDVANHSMPNGITEAETIMRVGDIFCSSGVILERTDGTALIRKLSAKYYSADDVFIYADPPYMMETRSTGDVYEHEMPAEQHADFLAACAASPCRVMISGYRSALYDEALADWHRIDVDVYPRITAGGKGGTKCKVRTESVWCNYTPAAGQSALF